MGRKRKHRDSKERLWKKLKRELKKTCRRLASDSDSSEFKSDSEKDDTQDCPYQCSDTEVEIHMSPERSPAQNEEIPQTLDTEGLLTTQEVTTETEADDNLNKSLPADILTLLGDAPKECPVGKDIHVDIATRMGAVLCNGLKKDEKDKLTEEYLIPGNCQFLKAPILNPEVKAAVSEMLQKKDASLAARQGQIGVVLSALTTAMDMLISKKCETALLMHVSNACRLLCDSHYMDTKIRRNFLISSLNNKLKDALKESKPEKYLFGDSLHERIKAIKAINRSSLDLKPYTAKPRSAVKQNKATGSTNHLNWKYPQPNHQIQNVYRKITTPAHWTAGSSSTVNRNKMPQKPMPAHASRTSAPYRHPKRS